MTRFAYSAPKAEGAGSGSRRLAIAIYDEIGAPGVSPAQVRDAIASAGAVDVIDVHLHSPGGSAFDGVAVYNLLRRAEARVHIRIDGMALSAASIVAMAGDRVEMAEGALMMVHDPWSMSVGTAQDHNDEAAVLNLVRDSLAGIYASRLTSGSEEQAREMMARETWLTASEAVALGLADDVREALPIAAYGDLSRFAAARTVKGDRTVEQAFTEWCLAYPALALTPHQPDPDMTTIHPKILAALDLPDEAEVDTIVSTIKAAKAVATQLAELTARKDMAEAMGTVRAWKDAAARHDEAVAALTALRVDAIQSEAETLIKDATPKKLTPALATYWRQEIEAAVQNNAGERALAQLKGYLAAATRILPEPSIQPSNNTTDVLGGYGGKPYAELQPAERAQLKRGQPDIYAALKAAARGES